MLNAEPIKREYGDYICRRCINRLYRVRLTPKDCRYGFVTGCRCCNEVHNIVTDFSFSGKCKMLLRR